MESEIKDVSAIHDEDILRRMWQATEDFGRKKEIRAHMYKLREARLKEFYTTGEVLRDVQRSNSSPGLREQQQKTTKPEGPTHADSLADHSFLSLKSKEVRDSESPTREVQYRNSKNRGDDGTWTINSKTEKSEDGKTITSSHTATTHGSRAIDNGKLSYAAANEEQTSLYADGDANNFTKCIGENSKTFAQQNIVTGDESNFHSSKSTTSSSSSRFVQHHVSTSGDVDNFNKTLAITGKDYTEDDNFKATKTHYTSSSEDYKNSQAKTTSTKVIQPEEIRDNKQTTTITKTVQTSADIPEDLKKSIADGNTRVYTETKTLPDGSTVTTTRYETKGTKKWSATSGSTQVTSNRQVVEEKSSSTTNNKINKQIEYISNDDLNTSKIIRDTDNKNESVRIIKSEKQAHEDKLQKNVIQKTEDVREKIVEHDRKIIHDQDTRDMNKTIESKKVIRTNDNRDQLQSRKEKPTSETNETHTTVTTTIVKSNVTDNVDQNKQNTIIKHDFVETKPAASEPVRPQDLEITKPIKPEQSYKPSTPTNDQYSTTYRQEFTNKRISVEVSPTHDAFARSLRAVSPDRIHDRPKSRGSVRTSTSSLRSSTSPEKQSIKSPERRSPDKHTPDFSKKYTSPNEQNPDRKSPKSPTKTDVTYTTKTTKLSRNQTTPDRPTRGSSPIKPVERTSPVRSPTKTTTEYTITCNTDTFTRKKKVTDNDDERRSPVRSPTKTGPSETVIINTDTITRRRKIPDDNDTKRSPTRSPTKTTETTTINTDTITRKKNIPYDDDKLTTSIDNTNITAVTETRTVNTDTITRKKNKISTEDVPDKPREKINPVQSPSKLKNKPDNKRNSPVKTNEKVIRSDVDKSEVVTEIIDTVTEKFRKPSSRDLSPTSLASDIEFINHNSHIITDLDEPSDNDVSENRPNSLDITTTTVTTATTKIKSSDSPKHPSSPVKDSPKQKSPVKEKSTPVKEVPKQSQLRSITPELDERPPNNFTSDDVESVHQKPDLKEYKNKPPFKRTETYEERCRQILGLTESSAPKTKPIDQYAGKEPVEEPIIVKKHIEKTSPDDELIAKTIEKINKRPKKQPGDESFYPEPRTLDESEIITEITDFITTEKRDVSNRSPDKVSKEIKSKPENEKPLKKTKSPDRKSPDKHKTPKSKPTDDGEYITEYADEYSEKTISPKKSDLETKPTTDTKDKKPSSKAASPDRKSPQRKQPKEGDYITEYTDEYCDKPDKPTEPKVTTKNIKKITVTDKKTTNSSDKKPNRQSPERKQKEQQKKQSKDVEYSTEYTDEYCETADIITLPKKPTGKDKVNNKTEITVTTTTAEKKIQSNNITPVKRAPSPIKKLPDKKSFTQKEPEDLKPQESTDDEQTIEKIPRETPSPVRRAPDSKLPNYDLPEQSSIKPTDFIAREKYDTDITLEITVNEHDAEPITKISPTKHLSEIELDIENENIQKTHVRTHRIDTTVVKTDKENKPKDTSPKRQPQKAVPAETMECTFNKTVTSEEKIIQSPKKPQKLSGSEDKKSPVKQLKEPIPKTTITTKTVTKKIDTDTKRRGVFDEFPKKKSPSEVKVPKEKSPERCDSPKYRSPSPTHKTVNKKIIETERNVAHVTKKSSSRDILVKKSQDVRIKPQPRTPSESSLRKPLHTSPATSPERKPIKQTSKPTIKEPVLVKPAESTKRHVVTKTISLSPRPDSKPRHTSPVKTSPKVVTTVKTTKITQPVSSITVATVKTTKTSKKTFKSRREDTDSSESEPEQDVIDISSTDLKTQKNRVVTSTNIKITNNVPKRSSPSRTAPNVTIPALKVNSSDNQPSSDNQKPSKKDKLTTKCITTKSIVLNTTDIEDLEFTIDLQRSTSSREQSPDKICPIPVSSEDEGSYPRYPDKVSEPDDSPSRRKPVKISDIPLTEEEDVRDFNRITEVTETCEKITRKPSTRITDIDKVTETDESLLSVNEKVSRFINTAEKLTDDEPKSKKVAPKVPRPELVVDEDLENDECLLSVSDKVTKFITTAEEVATKKIDSPKTPKPRENTPVDVKVNENDECLLSVNEKVNHFIKAATTDKPKSSLKDGPAVKVSRPQFTDVDETLKTDECLLSVSDKVNKFLTTADKLSTDVKTNKTEITFKRDTSPERITKIEVCLQRQRSPEKITPNTEKSRQSPVRKTPETIKKIPETTSQQPIRPKSEPTKPVHPTESKPVNLKSSEAVKKAKAMFENISKSPESPKQRDILNRPSIWDGRRKEKKTDEVVDDVKLTDIGVYKKAEPVRKQLTYSTDEEDTCRKISTNLKDVTLKSTKLILNENKIPRIKSPERETPGYMKPISKPVNNITKEEITVEKKITESRSPSRDIPGYMKSIPKVSPNERDKSILENRTRITTSPEKDTQLYKKFTLEQKEEIETTHKFKQFDSEDIPHYMLPLQRHVSPERDTYKKVTKEESVIETNSLDKQIHVSPEVEVPGYMRPLQRHTHTPDTEDRKVIPQEDVTEDSPRGAKKFGVTLRRTDSGRMITSTSSTTITERRRSSVQGQPIIEEIEDLEVLEKMMEKVIGYEQRRRIRAQIRIVKKLISENKISGKKIVKTTTTNTNVTGPKPRDISPKAQKSPIRDFKRSSVSPSKTSPEIREKSPESKQKLITTDIKITKKSDRVTSPKDRSSSPETKKRTTEMYKTDLKHVHPTTKTITDEKPSWIVNRNLKKTSEVTEQKRIVHPVKKTEVISRRSPSPQKEVKPIDCITSSYGIGPTDENGQPLFGIRALRKAADNKVHVRGTMVTSQYYSSTGQEPVGEVSVTEYSTDPQDLSINLENINQERTQKQRHGITSVTTTQKFGSRGTPKLDDLVNKKKSINNKHSEEDELFKTTSTKVTRRGSVKALSQKFIENAAEISRNERQTYPKAGLILRTSSFKDTTQASTDRSSSRESSPGYQGRPGKISLESITSDSRTTSHKTEDTTTKTFLNSHTRVANAQEVITRMKNAETEEHEGDSAEDREARLLLNKFLGAQVLLSGMEPLIATQQSSASSTAHVVRKVQKSRTVTSSNNSDKKESKTHSLTKRYQTPITTEILQDIWEEQTLRSLLEQCTDYEERRAIRARLRQVMAEQEAVANVVASAVADRDSGDRTSSMQERVETSKETFSEGPITTTQVSTTRVISSTKQISKPISPFAKFRQLDKQNSLNSTPSSPRTPTGTGVPFFKFTDPALNHSASTVKDRLLHWCQMKTKEYQNIKLENFSTSWADGMAFCALIHHFLPDAFDYHALTPQQRRHNFTLAFKVADEQADIAPLLDVDDMVAMRRPDWKCVFTYVQSIYRRFKDED